MKTNITVGKQGETLAKQFLLEQGFTVLHTNWRHSHNEIDLVCIDGNELVIVEVKTLQRAGRPEQSLTPSKEAELRKAADAYLHVHKLADVIIRFDVVAVVLHAYSSTPPEITHFKDAFH